MLGFYLTAVLPSIFPQINIDEANLSGVLYQGYSCLQIKLTHDIGTMVFYRLGTYIQIRCNRFGRRSLRQETKHLLLSGS